MRTRDWSDLAIKLPAVRGAVWPLVFHRPEGGFEPAIQLADGSVWFESLPYRMSLRTASAWAEARAGQAVGIGR